MKQLKTHKMNTLNIKATALTPAVNCTPSTGVIEISGRSLGVNPTEFWSEIQTWLLQYLDSPMEQTTINLEFEYLNTLSVKQLFTFLKISQFLQLKGHKVQINWIYEKYDEDILELGYDIQNLLTVPMQFKTQLTSFYGAA
jgi:hypothetical protein